MTGDDAYRKEAERLRRDHGYHRMLVNAKIIDPCDDNHSDDEEAFLPLYTYIMAYKALGRSREPEFDAALARFCRIVTPERPSLYLAICAVGNATPGAATRRRRARREPARLAVGADRVEHDNSSARTSACGRHGAARADGPEGELLPAADGARFKWNANPYRLDDGDGGNTEGDPAPSSSRTAGAPPRADQVRVLS